MSLIGLIGLISLMTFVLAAWHSHCHLCELVATHHSHCLAHLFELFGHAVHFVDAVAFKRVEAMIDSMTPYEREHPDCINLSRRQRIARGSGNSIEEVNRMTKQYAQWYNIKLMRI